MPHPKSYRLAFGLIALLTPIVAFAQQSFEEFGDFITRIQSGLNIIIVFLFLVATVLLLLGIVKYVAAGDDEDKVKEGRNLILFGIVGLAVMVALWAFVDVVIDFFFKDKNFSIPGPEDGLPQQ